MVSEKWSSKVEKGKGEGKKWKVRLREKRSINFIDLECLKCIMAYGMKVFIWSESESAMSRVGWSLRTLQRNEDARATMNRLNPRLPVEQLV